MNRLIEIMRQLYSPPANCPSRDPDTETPGGNRASEEKVMQLSLNNNVPQRTATDNNGREAKDCTNSLVRSLVDRANGKPVTIAPGVAKRILEETNFEGQRKVNEARVRERIDDIEHGRWQPQVCPITFAETPDGRLHCVNGQHRCHGIVRSGRKVENLITVIPVADMQQVRRLYALFDTPESKRSDLEMLDGSGVADALGLKRKTTASLFKALVILRNDMEPVPGAQLSDAKSRGGRLEEIGEWTAEARIFEQLIEPADYYLAKKMAGQGSMAFGLYVLRHRRKEAVEFIGGIANNDGLRKNDPRARLIADFSNRSISHGSLRQSVQRMAVAWNAFVTGRDLHIIKCLDGAPIVIRGTPKGKAGGR